MNISNICKGYFSGLQNIANFKINTKEDNILCILKRLLYFTVIIPLYFGIKYGLDSLFGRVNKKEHLTNQDQKVMSSVKAQLNTQPGPVVDKAKKLAKLTSAQKTQPVNQLELMKLTHTIAQIKGSTSSKDTESFVYRTEAEIKGLKGICLTPNNSSSSSHYRGIAVRRETNDVGQEVWRLKLCPGGGYDAFSVKDFEELMPVAINKLAKLNITPDELTENMGRHPGDTLTNFQTWQKQNSPYP